MLYDLSNDLDRENFKLRSNRLYEGKKIVELKEKKPKRSINQNSYLHLILGYFASQYGCSLEYCKEKYYKILCNKEIFIREKQDEFLGTIKVLRSSADLDTSEMTTSIERFRNWSASEAGIYLPSPDEDRLLSLCEMEVERNKNYV